MATTAPCGAASLTPVDLQRESSFAGREVESYFTQSESESETESESCAVLNPESSSFSLASPELSDSKGLKH